MKFHCDRCKTRYSISAERVRGKILKIRCKNCSAVITVREDMPAAEVEGSGSHAVPRPPVPAFIPDAPSAPVTMEWYLAQDGVQSGPMTQPAAEQWIKDRAGAPELFCWAEGWADWKPVESIPAFQAVRKPPQRAAPVLPPRAPTSPSAAAAMPAATATLDFDPGVLHGGDFQVDIDEASRVVRLPLGPSDIGLMEPVLERARTVPDPVPAPQQSHFNPRLVRLSEAAPIAKPKRNGMMILAVSLIAVMVGGLALVLVLATRQVGDGSVATRSAMADETLGRDFKTPQRRAAVANPAEPVQTPTAKTTPPRDRKPPEIKAPVADLANADSDLVALPDENSTEIVQGNLDPDVVTRKAKKSNILFTRCHERALKADPLLEVPKAVAKVTIAPNGRVSEVSIPGFEGTPLGTCLVTAMRGWKFQQSTEGLVTQMTITFGR